MAQFPGNRGITLDYAAALEQTGRYETARQLLTDYLRLHNPAPDVYSLLSRAYGNLGQNAQSHRYLAEYYYVTGQTKPAITQARIGLKQAVGNYYLTAVLEDRLKLFVTEEQERKQQSTN